MRKSKIALAFLATLSISVTAQADDFSALLADLSFGDTPSLNEPLTLTDPPEQQQLRAAPTELVMPEIDAPTVSLQEGAPTVSLREGAPTVSLQEPLAADLPQTVPQIDLDAAFALQEIKSGVDAQAASHLLDHDKQGSCDEGILCTPHVPASLPTSSFYQYFRSNKCNTNVWDGYRQNCRSANKHLNGTCDCFKVKPKKKRDDCCGQIYDAPVAACNDCEVRPRRKILPIEKSCNDCTACETSCDAGCDDQ